MGDPISVAAGIFGIATFASEVVKTVAKIVNGVKEVDENVRSFQDIVTALEHVLRDLERSFDRKGRSGRIAANQRGTLERTLKSCNEYLYRIRKRIPEFPDEDGGFQRAYKKLKASLQTTLMITMQSRLQAYTQMLQLAMTADEWEHRQKVQELARDMLLGFEEGRKQDMAPSADDENRQVSDNEDPEDNEDVQRIEDMTDRDLKDWSESVQCLGDAYEYERTPQHALNQRANRRPTTLEFDYEPQLENSLPEDTTVAIISELERQAKIKMKSRMHLSAAKDQREAIRRLDQCERIHGTQQFRVSKEGIEGDDEVVFLARVDLEEALAENMSMINTQDSRNEAKEIMRRLLDDAGTSSERETRLCHSLARTYLKEENLNRAEKFANRAFSRRRELLGEQKVTLESARLVEEVYRRKGDHVAADVIKRYIVENEAPDSAPGSQKEPVITDENFYHWLREHGYDNRKLSPMETKNPTTGLKPLQHAIDIEDVNIVDFILHEYGFALEMRDSDDATPLLQAAAHKHCILVERILQHNPNTSAIDKSGDTALHRVQSKEKGVKVAKLLLSHREPISVDQTNHEGKTALHLAVGLGNIQMIECLLAHGADINAQTQTTGRTPLHQAVETKRVEVVPLLLSKGADFSTRDRGELTALDLAREMPKNKEMVPQEIIAALEDAGRSKATNEPGASRE